METHYQQRNHGDGSSHSHPIPAFAALKMPDPDFTTASSTLAGANKQIPSSLKHQISAVGDIVIQVKFTAKTVLTKRHNQRATRQALSSPESEYWEVEGILPKITSKRSQKIINFECLIFYRISGTLLLCQLLLCVPTIFTLVAKLQVQISVAAISINGTTKSCKRESILQHSGNITPVACVCNFLVWVTTTVLSINTLLGLGPQNQFFTFRPYLQPSAFLV